MPATSSVTVASFPAKDNGRKSMPSTARAVLLVFMADTSAADYIATWDPQYAGHRSQHIRGSRGLQPS